MAGLRVWLRKLLSNREEPVPANAVAPAREPNSLEGNNDFALAMYRLLRQSPGNLFFSPFSIRTALGMTQAGAMGKTAAEMVEALRMPTADETVHAAFAEAIQQLNVTSDGEYEIAVANSLWGQNGARILTGFRDLIARHYGCGINFVDFRRGAETARVSMNEWVADKTRQKIRDFIPVRGVNAGTRMVLLNVGYFKGIWDVPFDSAATRDERFYLENGGKTRVPLMHLETEIRYRQGAGYQAVELVYRGW